MHLLKRLSLLGSIVIVTSLLLTFFGATTVPAFAATRTTQKDTLAATAINACPPELKEGSSGVWVQILQFRLNALNAQNFVSFTPLATDGNFGSLTLNAVKAFQSSTSGALQVDGEVGNNTWTALDFCAVSGGLWTGDGGFSTFTHCPTTLNEGSSGTLVSGLQSLLNGRYIRGYFDNSPYPFTVYLSADGSFGSQTFNAVKDFQTDQQIGVDGSVGPQTWSTIGMCY